MPGEEGDEARKLTYQQFPQKFVWNKNKKKWSLRQRGLSIGRMYYIPPTAAERFYIRTLLAVVPGPKSFEDLRTYKGVVYPTYKDACAARGLLADDGEWRLALDDALHLSTLPIRALFKEAKYKNKKPLPANHFNVAVEGVIDGFERDSVDTRRPAITPRHPVGLPQSLHLADVDV